MKLREIKGLTTICGALTSILVVSGIVKKTREQKHQDTCQNSHGGHSGEQGKHHSCQCHQSDAGITEMMVSDRSSKRTGCKCKSPDSDKIRTLEATDMLENMFEDIKEMPLTNTYFARVITDLINLQKIINPDEAIDIRDIRFVNNEKQGSMVIDLYTEKYGKTGYEDELCRLWCNVFPTENFWEADFMTIGVDVKEAKTGELLETITCSLDDAYKYLLKEISLDDFKRCWNKSEAKITLAKKPSKAKTLKRAQ